MLRDRWPAHAGEALGDVAGAQAVGAQQVEDLPARGIGDRGEDVAHAKCDTPRST